MEKNWMEQAAARDWRWRRSMSPAQLDKTDNEDNEDTKLKGQ